MASTGYGRRGDSSDRLSCISVYIFIYKLQHLLINETNTPKREDCIGKCANTHKEFVLIYTNALHTDVWKGKCGVKKWV